MRAWSREMGDGGFQGEAGEKEDVREDQESGSDVEVASEVVVERRAVSRGVGEEERDWRLAH